jgi:hypothetical protein
LQPSICSWILPLFENPYLLLLHQFFSVKIDWGSSDKPHKPLHHNRWRNDDKGSHNQYHHHFHSPNQPIFSGRLDARTAGIRQGLYGLGSFRRENYGKTHIRRLYPNRRSSHKVHVHKVRNIAPLHHQAKSHFAKLSFRKHRSE